MYESAIWWLSTRRMSVMRWFWDCSLYCIQVAFIQLHLRACANCCTNFTQTQNFTASGYALYCTRIVSRLAFSSASCSFFSMWRHCHGDACRLLSWWQVSDVLTHFLTARISRIALGQSRLCHTSRCHGDDMDDVSWGLTALCVDKWHAVRVCWHVTCSRCIGACHSQLKSHYTLMLKCVNNRHCSVM